MSLRWKIIIVVSVTALAVIGAGYAISQVTFARSFQQLEKRDTEAMANRARSALSDRIQNLHALNHDWAAWDDTYNFVQHPEDNQDYIRVNPTDTTFASAGLNFIFIINNERQVVFSKGFDLENNKPMPVPASLDDVILSDAVLQHSSLNDSKAGIVVLPEGPLLLSSQPVITSEGEGPVAGTIIMARYFDSGVIDGLFETVHLPISAAVISDNNAPADFELARASLSTQAPVFTLPLDSDSIAGYALVNDIYGQPAVILKSVMPRDIYTQGTDTARYFLFFLLLLAALVGYVFYIAIGRLVLRRLTAIGNHVSHIRGSGDLSKRLSPAGHDELCKLARDIDGMVAALQKSGEVLRLKKETEARLRSTIESVADGIIVTNLDNKITQVNDAAVRLHGYSNQQELIGRHFLALIAEEEHASVIEKLKNAVDTGHVGHVENTLVKKDGSRLPVEVTVAKLLDTGGNMSGFVASVRDVSGRKMVESDLRGLLDSFASGAFLIDPETHQIAYANQTAVNIFGVSKDHLLGHVCHRFVCPADVGKCPVTDLGQTVNVSERKLLNAAGNGVPILKSVNPVTWQGRRYLFETFIDITERKKAETVLKQQKELIDRILAAMPAAVLVIDSGSKVVLANKTFFQAFKMEDINGKTVIDIIPVDELAKLISDVQSGQSSNVTGEFRYSIAGHERIFVANVLKMWQDEILLILNDITQERARQEKFFMTERLASVGEMAAGVAHELNNPLTSVIGLSQLLVEEEDPKEIKEDLEAIYSEARRAGNIVRNMLTFARKHAPEKQLLDIDSVLQDVLKLRAYEHKVNNIGVETFFDPGVPQVVADYYQIQQVFLNIILNAEQAMIEAHGGGKLTVAAQKANDMLKISFADNGPGIQPENLKRIFDPFFTTKDVGKGTGLGLSICYGIVTEHGGKIYAESEYGKGATFIVELPIHNN